MTALLICAGVFFLMAAIGIALALSGSREPQRRTPPSTSNSVTQLLAGLTPRIPTDDEADHILDPAFKEFMRTSEVDVKWVKALDESDARHGRLGTVQR